jgi:hypothetical protein
MVSRASRTEARRAAVEIYSCLARGGRIRAVTLPYGVWARLSFHPRGEETVGYFPQGSMRFARYYATQDSGPMMVVGSPAFVAGAVLGSVARAARRRARWHTMPLLNVVITTRRLLCEVIEPGHTRWLHIDYSGITGMAIEDDAMELYFDGAAEPLRLAGDDALWCAAVIAHYRYGQAATEVLPMLHAAAIAS